MKKIILLATITSFTFLSTNSHAAPLLHCREVVLLSSNEAGDLTPMPTGMSVSVVANANGLYGYAAEISRGADTATELDVDKISLTAAESGQFREITSLALPKLDWARVSRVEGFNIGVKANQQDAAGGMIVGLVAADGTELGQVLQYGWGFGYCAE